MGYSLWGRNESETTERLNSNKRLGLGEVLLAFNGKKPGMLLNNVQCQKDNPPSTPWQQCYLVQSGKSAKVEKP